MSYYTVEGTWVTTRYKSDRCKAVGEVVCKGKFLVQATSPENALEHMHLGCSISFTRVTITECNNENG